MRTTPPGPGASGRRWTTRAPPSGGADPQGNPLVAVGVAERVVDAFFQATASGPDALRVAPEPVNSRSLDYIDYLAPGILAMSVMQTGVFGLTFFIVTAREKRILKRLQATPIGATMLLAGRLLPALVVVLIQSPLLLPRAAPAF